MAVLGSTSKPTTTQEWFGLNSTNQMSMSLTLPGSGGPWRVYRIGGWIAGSGMTSRVRFCLWDSSNNLERQSSQFTASNLSFGLGNTVNYEQDISDYIAANGESVQVGFHRHSDDSTQNGRTGSGTHYHKTVGDSPISMASKTSDGGLIGFYLYYEAANSVPTAPTLTSPANGARITDLTPDLDWTHNDPDGDPQTARQIQVDNNSDFSSPVWDSTVSTSSTIATYAGSALSRGVTYYWRVRTSDAEGYGPFSSYRTFKVNSLPTATVVSPPSQGFPYIWNLGVSTSEWTAGGAAPAPQMDWTYSDPDGDAQSAYQLKIWTVASGGTAVYDTGIQSSSATLLNTSFNGVMGTTYYWAVVVRDAYNEWSGNIDSVSRTAFKMRFAQAIYEHQLPALGSSGWQWSNAAAGGGQAAFLFRTATGTGGTGATSWKTSIGAVTRITSGTEYLNVLVRLAPSTAGTDATLADMTFTYIASAIQPEKWSFSTPTADWALDGDVRRYGSQSLRFVMSATPPAVAYAWQSVSVSPNTDYVFHGFVNLGTATLVNGGYVALVVYDIDTSSVIYQSDTTTNTEAHPEGWQRLQVKFNSGAHSSLVMMALVYAGTLGDTVWFDALQLEEGDIATPWRPGLVGDAAVVDVGGVAIDGLAGGIFRVRGTAGGTRDVVSLGANGLVFGGDTEVSSNGANSLRVNNKLSLGTSGVATGAIGIMFGADVELYRAAANELRTLTGDSLYGTLAGRWLLKSSTQSINNTTYSVVTSWSTTPFLGVGVTYDGTDELVVDRDGLYLCLIRAAFATSSTGVRLLGVDINDTTTAAPSASYQERHPVNSDTNDEIFHTTLLLPLSANDRVCMKVWQNSGGALNMTGASLAVVLLGHSA